MIVQEEGNREITRLIEYYNLDVIISVGYRVKSENVGASIARPRRRKKHGSCYFKSSIN